MIKGLFQTLLRKSGKAYTVDPDLPSSLILKTLIRRGFMLFRGYLKLYRKVYVGSGCSFSNSSNIITGRHVTFENHVRIDGYAKQPLIFGDCVRLGAYSWVSCTSHMSKYGKGLSIGKNSAVGQFTEFGASGGITIGEDVIMGSYISFHSENHNFEDRARPIREQGVTSKGISIGNDVWVGAKVTFLDGCVVGNHCVVAAGAVVNGVYPDYSVIGGIPAKVLKTRD